MSLCDPNVIAGESNKHLWAPRQEKIKECVFAGGYF